MRLCGTVTLQGGERHAHSDAPTAVAVAVMGRPAVLDLPDKGPPRADLCLAAAVLPHLSVQVLIHVLQPLHARRCAHGRQLQSLRDGAADVSGGVVVAGGQDASQRPGREEQESAEEEGEGWWVTKRVGGKPQVVGGWVGNG